ncbi:MAG: RHS repeat domain-containing protein [Flavobacteriales bacterium]
MRDPFSQKCHKREYFYGFNGKEKIDEVYGIEGTAYDFGARLYDSRLGRWIAVDSWAGKYPDLRPYVFVANLPIVFIDPDGEKIVVGVVSDIDPADNSHEQIQS